MAKIIIARHAQSTDNEKGVISGGMSNPGLTQKGESQADELGRLLSLEYSNKFSYMVTSNMLRANQTANIANQHLQIKQVYYNFNLREKDYGELEGKENNEEVGLKNLGFYEFAPGGENDEIFTQRITGALCEHLKAEELWIFIVAHGYTIAKLTEYFLDNEQYLENAKYIVIDPENIIDLNGKCRIEMQDNYCSNQDET